MTTNEQIGEDRLRQWMQDRIDRVKQDWDELIIVTGPERMGKSSLAFQMSCWMDPDFDPEVQTVFTGEAFRRRAVQMPKYRPLVLDEAIKGAFSRRAVSGENVGLAEYLTVGGERNLINFICWPGSRWLDPLLREWRSTWNLHVVRRMKDVAIAQVRQWHDGETVFEKPRVHFSFAYPRPRGPKWEAYLGHKATFVERIGRTGGNDGQERRDQFYEETMDLLGPVVKRLVAELA